MTDKITVNQIESRSSIAEIDKGNVYGSIEALVSQIDQAWQDTREIEFEQKKDIKNIIIAGMGGSGLGADVVKSLFKQRLQVPLEVVNSYSLPQYAAQDTLVVLSSYSGNTEEVLSCAKQAKDSNCQLAVITSGGSLKQIATEDQLPAYIITPKHNPSNQPRMAIGYAIVGLMGLLERAGLISISAKEIKQAGQAVIATGEDCQVDLSTEQNPAKTLAFNCIDRRPILVGAQFLQGALHTATNQFNENAKTFADYKIIPEINHHLLEALENPVSNRLDHLFLFFESDLYHQQIQKRVKLTQEAVEKAGIQTLAIKLEAKTEIAQVFELITLMAYTNFYLAMLYNINPSPIEMVDWFKAQLK